MQFFSQILMRHMTFRVRVYHNVSDNTFIPDVFEFSSHDEATVHETSFFICVKLKEKATANCLFDMAAYKILTTGVHFRPIKSYVLLIKHTALQ